MPLKCLAETAPVYAFQMDSADWTLLREENRKHHHLKMECCGSSVVLKENRYGTRYFAHTKKGECTTASETAEHLMAKEIIARAVIETGWEAVTECRSETVGDTEMWVADVMAIQGTKRVALEIQWSRQSDEETAARQDRYRRSKVRGIWFFRQPHFPKSQEIPAFKLDADAETATAWVKLPSRSHHVMSARDQDDDYYWQQRVELGAFVKGALTGRLLWAPAIGQTLPVIVKTAATECWRCHRETYLVMRLIVYINRIFAHHPDLALDIYAFDGHPAFMNAVLPPALCKEHGVGAVKHRYSNTRKRTYMSNGCVHCDALQGMFFDHDLAYAARPSFETEITLSEEVLTVLGEHRTGLLNRWWFDDRCDK